MEISAQIAEVWYDHIQLKIQPYKQKQRATSNVAIMIPPPRNTIVTTHGNVEVSSAF